MTHSRELPHMISTIPLVVEAFQEMLPLIGIFAAITVIYKLVEAFEKAKAAEEKLAESQVEFSIQMSSALQKAGDELLTVGIKADELRGDHIDALQKELVLIDHASMNELRSTFDKLGSDFDKVLDQMKAKWYDFGIGSEAVRSSFDRFKTQYDEWVAGGEKGVDPLKATLVHEENILDLMHRANNLNGSKADRAYRFLQLQ